jgi:capsular exopolysaccharide synthesis family protein
MATKTNPSKLINLENQNKVPFSIVEAYKSLRVHLLSLLENYNGKIIAVSSPNASEGKTTTAINTAITFSQLNKKVIIVDTDSRRPSVHQKLKLTNDIGCLDVVTEKVTLADAVKHHNEYLDVLTVGSASNSSELFSSAGFDKLLLELRDKYDYIIVDTPPVNLVSDSLVVSQKCDGLLLVVRTGVTTYTTFNESLANIKKLGIKLFGTVMNGIGGEAGKYGKYKGYKKYYGSK